MHPLITSNVQGMMVTPIFTVNFTCQIFAVAQKTYVQYEPYPNIVVWGPKDFQVIMQIFHVGEGFHGPLKFHCLFLPS